MKETLAQAGYRHVRTLPHGEHILQETAQVEDIVRDFEVWRANKGHASYGIVYKNTHLEFCYSLKLEAVKKPGL